LIGAGCRATMPQPKIEGSIHSEEDLSVTPQQAHLRMRALVEPLSGAIVESADRIKAGTSNRVMQREALLWKIEGVSALREALFRPNPYAAILDTWVLTRQMENYFASGRGKEALGAAAPAAVSTCQYLEQQVEAVTVSFTKSGDATKVRAFAREWADSHPIRHSIGSRESTLSRITEREIQETFSAQELAGNLVVTLDDLTRRMDVYSVQLLDQSRWQAELFTLDMTENFQLDQAMPLAETAVQSATEAVATLNRLEPSVQDTLDVAISTPALISRERIAAIEAAQAEISRTLKFVQSEREITLKELNQTIAAERKLILAETERIADGAVDHAMYRMAQLTAVVLGAVFVGVVVLLFITRRVFSARALSKSG
jgi:hypothetical protein